MQSCGGQEAGATPGSWVGQSGPKIEAGTPCGGPRDRTETCILGHEVEASDPNDGRAFRNQALAESIYSVGRGLGPVLVGQSD